MDAYAEMESEFYSRYDYRREAFQREVGSLEETYPSDEELLAAGWISRDGVWVLPGAIPAVEREAPDADVPF